MLAVLLGVLAGIGGFTFLYAEGLSYLSDDPKACVNCHIMQPQYDSWQKASHHTVATCVDCHLPHGFDPQVPRQGRERLPPSKAFTLQDFPEPIMIKREDEPDPPGELRALPRGLVHEQIAGATDGYRRGALRPLPRSVGHGETTGVGRR